jgi:glycosyltransferase involved in cell wall biosynthesis
MNFSVNPRRSIELDATKTICYLGNAQSVHLQRLSFSFARKGYDVHLITHHEPPTPIEGVKVHKLPNTVKKRFIGFLLEGLIIKRLIKGLNPHILHAVSATPWGFWAATEKKIPMVLWAWGGDVLRVPFISKNIKFGVGAIIKAPMWRLIVSFALKRANVIYAESEYIAKFIQRVFSIPLNKIRFFPWGVDTDTFREISEEVKKEWYNKLNIDENNVICLSPRSIVRSYRIETILRSVPSVVESNPNVVFVFIKGWGDENYLEELKELANGLKISDRIRFIDYTLRPCEMAQIMHISHILISIPTHEAFPITVLEGLLSKCIPVISDIPANRELASMGVEVFFVQGDNPEELAGVLKEIIARRLWLDENILEKNKEWVVKNATQELTINKMEEIYTELLSGDKND